MGYGNERRGRHLPRERLPTRSSFECEAFAADQGLFAAARQGESKNLLLGIVLQATNRLRDH